MSLRKAFCLVLLVLIGSLAETTAGAEGERKSAGTEAERIPRNLSMYLTANFPALAILRREDASEDVHRALAFSGIKQASPFACSGDFNGDGLQDYALLLRDRHTARVKFMAFHQTREHTYVPLVVDDMRETLDVGQRSDIFIICEKPGRKRTVGGAVIPVRNNAISIEYWGKGALLYYFEDGGYKSMITAD